MKEHPENSLQTAARWTRNAAVGVAVTGAALKVAAAIGAPILQERARFRRNRGHGTVPVDHAASSENIERLEGRVQDFKQQLVDGESLLDLYREDAYLSIQGWSLSGRNKSNSIEDLLDKALVPTMSPERYHEIEAWWDEVTAQAHELEAREEAEEAAVAAREEEVRKGGIWAEHSQAKGVSQGNCGAGGAILLILFGCVVALIFVWLTGGFSG